MKNQKKANSMIYSAVILITVGFGISNAQTPNTIKIGSQNWQTKNLDVSTFRNGDTIPKVQDAVEWRRAGLFKEPAWCYYYENNLGEITTYGKYYNWYAVNDSRGLAPEGWHVPSDEEWNILIDYLGGDDVAGKKLKSKTGWKIGNGNNRSGFSAIPAGKCVHLFDDFERIDEWAYWWSSSEMSYFSLDEEKDAVVSHIDKNSSLDDEYKWDGLSVRCLEGELTGSELKSFKYYIRDSIIGKTTKIGNLEIVQFDFSEPVHINIARYACVKLGIGQELPTKEELTKIYINKIGWRLPTYAELEIMYLNKDKIGGFEDTKYWWYNHNEYGAMWGLINIQNNAKFEPRWGIGMAKVRAVRTF